jgi:WS/DGAT/MGAT family acyltransferase
MTASTDLSILDAAILAMDSPETPMHLGGPCIIQLPADAGPDYVKGLFDSWRRVEVTRAPLTHRLARRSFPGLLATWEKADRVDLAGHLFHVALPTPGGRRELAELMGRLYATPFDRSRPLWEIYLIEGLSRRRFAMYTKIHHALMDGTTAMRVLMAPLSEDPRTRDNRPAWASPVPVRVGTVATHGMTTPRGTAGRDWTARRLLDELTQLPAAVAKLRSLAAGDVPAPDTILNRPVTPRRFTDSAGFDLAGMRAVGRLAGSTVNDVSLAVCAGALRRYLRENAELPADTLRALVPVAIARTGEVRSGNLASAITVPLATDVEAPKRRLDVITRATRAAKDAIRDATPEYLTALRGALLMAPAAAEQLVGVRLFGRPPYNLAISNVPGPARKLYLNGAEMEQIVPNFLVGPGMALSILLTSYHDRLGITVSACPDTVPGVERIVPMLQESFAELDAAVRKASRNRARRG